MIKLSFPRKQESRKMAWKLKIIEKENQPWVIYTKAYADSPGFLLSQE